MNPLPWIQRLRSPMVVLACGALLLCIALGIRHAFGLFLRPMSGELGWGRESFALAIAVQNLVWGLAQPFAGRWADRWGAAPVAFAGGVLYVVGLYLMAQVQSESALLIGAGLIVGLGLAGTGFPIVFTAISRTLPARDHSWATGVAMAVGSFGQFALLPTGNWLIEISGWRQALIVLMGLALLLLPLALCLPAAPKRTLRAPARPLREVLAEAFGQRSFWLLGLGFFVCGFQVLFVGTHLPAYLVDQGLSLGAGATVLGLVGLFNVFGTLAAGRLGARYPKPRVLVWIYAARLLVIGLFVALPVSTASAYAFGMAMGLLWLSTVPPTNGTVATLFGIDNLAMLGGIVFLFHQLGAFLGGWLGGVVYDHYGSYDVIWGLSMALSLLAALLNLWVVERPLAARQPGLAA